MKSIMVVEDEESLRTALADVISAEDYRVAEAENGADCMRMLLEDKFDLILLDIEMPVMNGLEVLDQINKFKDRSKKPYVVALSNKDDFKTIDEAQKSGVLHYFVKTDYTLDMVIDRINKILDEE